MLSSLVRLGHFLSVTHVFQQRHLVLLWFSQLLSAIGDHLYEIAVVWLAVQLVASEAGFVLSAGALSRLVLGLLGGVYADRWDRRKTMLTVDLMRCGVVLTLPIASLLGPISMWHLAAATTALGGLSALFDPALQASLPTVIENTHTLQVMNGLMDVTRRLARIFGPGLAGVLVALMPIPQLFTVDALTFGVSAYALVSLRQHFPRHPRAASSPARRPNQVFSDLFGAVQLTMAHHPFLWSLIGNSLTALTWSAVFTVGLALYVHAAFDASVGAYGWIVAAYGVGNVLSNIVISNLRIQRRALVYFLGKIVVGVGFLSLACAATLPVALLSAGVAAIGGPMGDVPLLITIQRDFPAHHVGKIYSLRLMLSGIGSSLGLLLAAPVFARWSPRMGIVLLALATIAVGGVGALRWYGSQERVPSSRSRGSS
jgi:DHA3 family macrolide efflux protein-like MFS transporter